MSVAFWVFTRIIVAASRLWQMHEVRAVGYGLCAGACCGRWLSERPVFEVKVGRLIPTCHE